MRTILKSNEPDSLTEHKKKLHADYDNYTDKKTLREYLVKEQRGLCCYCQSRIRATEEAMKIEHWHSQSPNKYPEEQLNYKNLLAACRGGQKYGEKTQKEKLHCDTLKGDDEICFCLSDTAHPIEQHIQFLGDGRIKSGDANIERDINIVLNLNLSHLVENRKGALKGFQDRLTMGKKLDVAKELPKWDGSQAGDLPEYAQVIVYWLRKKQTRARVAA